MLALAQYQLSQMLSLALCRWGQLILPTVLLGEYRDSSHFQDKNVETT